MMMAKQPTNYNERIFCSECDEEIGGDVYVDDFGDPICEDCYLSLPVDDQKTYRWMNRNDYLDDKNDRDYEEYCDKYIDEIRDAELEERYERKAKGWV